MCSCFVFLLVCLPQVYDEVKHHLPWLLVLDWGDFVAIPAEAAAPTVSQPRVGLVRAGPDVGLKEYAAKVGFNGVNVNSVSYLARDLGLAPAGDRLDVAAACITTVLGCSPAEAWAALDSAARAEISGPLAVDDGILRDILGEDKGTFEKAEKLVEETRQSTRVVRKQISEKARAHSEAAATHASGAYWQAKPKAAQWSEDEVMALLPTDAPVRCRRQASQGRWYIEYKRVGVRSASWGIHGGEDNAVRHVCREAWLLHEQVTGVGCAGGLCPVAGLW